MTRENAIKILKSKMDGHTDTSYEWAETVRIAIQALEQEPCDDTISRQAVLSYIYNDLGLGDEENGADIERQGELEKSYEYVKSLPPVTPQPKMGRWIEKEGKEQGYDIPANHGKIRKTGWLVALLHGCRFPNLC